MAVQLVDGEREEEKGYALVRKCALAQMVD